LRHVELGTVKQHHRRQHFFGNNVFVLLGFVFAAIVKKLMLALLHVTEQFFLVDAPALKSRLLVFGAAVDLHKGHHLAQQLLAR